MRPDCSVPPNRAGNAAFAILAAVLVAVPLAIWPDLYFFDITPKITILWIGAPLLLVATALALPAPRGVLAALLGALAAVSILATLFSVRPVLSLVGSDWRRLGLPAMLACLAIGYAAHALTAGDAARVRLLLAAIAAAGALVAVYAILQSRRIDPWIDPALYTIGEGEWAIVRPPGTLGYVSYLATYILYILFTSAGLALSSRAWPARVFWTLAALAAAMALLVTGARGAWLGSLAGVAILVAGIPQRRAVLLGVLGFSLAGALFWFSAYGQPTRSRIRWFVEDPAGGGRLLLWRDAASLASRHILLGTGPDTFETSFPPHQSQELSQLFPDRYSESPHNVLLDHWTTTGLGGMLAFAALAALALRNFFRAGGALPLALLAATAAALVSMQFAADTMPTRLYFMTYAGLSFSLAPGASPPRGRSWTFAAVGAVALVVALFFGVRLWQADAAMQRARAAVLRGDLEGAVKSAQRATELFPWGGSYSAASAHLLGNVLMSPTVDPAARNLLLVLALKAGHDAVPQVGSPQLTDVRLASLYVVANRFSEARGALHDAARAAPQWYRPHYLLAELLLQQGQKQDAAREARAALLLGAREHPEITQRCLQIEQLTR